MVQVLIIDKAGNINHNNITNINELYKKCGFKKIDGFELINSWIYTDDITIQLWGRLISKGLIKNGYKFPMPIEKSIYGNCALVAQNGDYIDLSIEIWDNICNKINNKTVDNLSDKLNSLDNEVEKLKNLSLKDAEKTEPEVLDDSDGSVVSDISDDSSSEDEDSELKPECYIYSSEEELS